MKIAVILLIFLSTSFSEVGISGFASVPVGEFADPAPSGGLAQTRFGVSAEFLGSVSPNMLIGVEGDFILNTLDKQAFANYLLDQGATSASVSGGNYFNFPVLAVASFLAPISLENRISLFGGIGVDFLAMTDMDLTVNGNSGKAIFDPGAALAWEVGAKILFDYLFVGVKYMDLGKHTINSELQSSSGNSNSTGDQKVAIIGILAGVKF